MYNNLLSIILYFLGIERSAMSLMSLGTLNIHCSVLSFLIFPTSRRTFCNKSYVTLHSSCLTRQGDLPTKRKWLLPRKCFFCFKNMYTAHWPSCVRTLPQQCLLLQRIKICFKEHFTVAFLDKEVFLELCEDITSTFVSLL